MRPDFGSSFAPLRALSLDPSLGKPSLRFGRPCASPWIRSSVLVLRLSLRQGAPLLELARVLQAAWFRMFAMFIKRPLIFGSAGEPQSYRTVVIFPLPAGSPLSSPHHWQTRPRAISCEPENSSLNQLLLLIRSLDAPPPCRLDTPAFFPDPYSDF